VSRLAEASAAYVRDRFFLSTLATVLPTPADFVNFPMVQFPDTASREIDFPVSYCKLITLDWSMSARAATLNPIFNCPRAALCMSTHRLSAARFVASSLSLRSGAPREPKGTSGSTRHD
jgi:hypothetical protein